MREPSQPPHDEAKPGLAERRLACAVIETAWIDYLGFDRRDSHEAREWILNTESNFPEWCDLAGLPAGIAQRIRCKVLDTTPLWLEMAEAEASGQPAPTPSTPTRQRVHAVTRDRGRPRKDPK